MILVLPALLALLSVAWFSGTGHDRSPAIHRYLLLVMVGVGLVMAAHQDWFVLALWTYCCANALRFPWPMHQLLKFASAGVLYLLVQTLHAALTPDLLPWVLMALIGLANGQLVLYVAHRRWSGNQNHTDMLMAMGIASALALGVLQHWAWVVAALPLALPFARKPGQAYLWVSASIVGLCALFVPYAALGGLLGGGAYCVFIASDWRKTATHRDHGRIRIWTLLLTLWWRAGWKARVLGLGPDSWRRWTDDLSRLEQRATGKPGSAGIFTHPHNEYVHVLFEHGSVGLGLLLCWIGSLLWQVWTVQPALLIPGVTLCAIAFTCFPWTLPYEVGMVRNNRQEYDPFGCIGMVLVTAVFVAVLL